MIDHIASATKSTGKFNNTTAMDLMPTLYPRPFSPIGQEQLAHAFSDYTNSPDEVVRLYSVLRTTIVKGRLEP